MLQRSVEFALVGLVGVMSGLVLGVIADMNGSPDQNGRTQRYGMRTALVSASALLLCASVITTMRPGAYALMVAAIAIGFSFFPIFGLLHAYVGKTSTPALAAMVCGICEAAFGVSVGLGNVAGGLCKTLSGSFQPVYGLASVAALLLVGLTLLVPNTRRACAGLQKRPCQFAVTAYQTRPLLRRI